MNRFSFFKVFTIASFCAFSLASQPTDTNGWNKTSWGMTEDQVLAALPGLAQRQAGPEAERPFRGLITPIIIKEVEIGGVPMTVHLQFDEASRQLARVLIQPIDPNHKDEQTYQRLELSLIAKYGRPWRSTTGEVRTSLWRLPSSLIELRLVTTRTINFRSLSLIYQPRREEPLL